MKEDRLYLRTLVKEGNGEEIEEILLRYKKKQGNIASFGFSVTFKF